MSKAPNEENKGESKPSTVEYDSSELIVRASPSSELSSSEGSHIAIQESASRNTPRNDNSSFAKRITQIAQIGGLVTIGIGILDFALGDNTLRLFTQPKLAYDVVEMQTPDVTLSQCVINNTGGGTATDIRILLEGTPPEPITVNDIFITGAEGVWTTTVRDTKNLDILVELDRLLKGDTLEIIVNSEVMNEFSCTPNAKEAIGIVLSNGLLSPTDYIFLIGLFVLSFSAIAFFMWYLLRTRK